MAHKILVHVNDAHKHSSVSTVWNPRPLCPSLLELKEIQRQSACPNVTTSRPTDACTCTPQQMQHHSSKAVLCLSSYMDVNAASQVQGLFLSKPLHCSSKTASRPLLLPGRFKWGWVKLRMGTFLSVLLKHAVKPAWRKRRNAIKTVLLYKWDLAGLPLLPQQPFFPLFSSGNEP